MPDTSTRFVTSTEVDYVCVAADLLSRMMSELDSLQSSNRYLALALATAGHDLRQRLHTLLRTVELLNDSDADARRYELGRRAKTLVFRLAGEFEQLALQAEALDGENRPDENSFVISPLLEHVRNDWELEANAKRLAFNVQRSDCLVESDQRLLGVILHNVVGNAIKHTAQGEVTVSTTVQGQFLVVTVADTGPGISDEHLRRSFSLSSRLGGRSEGMGLGLAIARKTADVLRHPFEVSTAPHCGTCVRLHVPLASHSVEIVARGAYGSL